MIKPPNPRRPLRRVLRGVLPLIASLTLVSIGCASGSDGTAGTTTSTSVTTTSTTTTLPAPSTTSLTEAKEAAFSAGIREVWSDEGSSSGYTIDTTWEFENHSDKTITAFQVVAQVSVEDSLGRVYGVNLLNTCSDTHIEPGASLKPQAADRSEYTSEWTDYGGRAPSIAEINENIARSEHASDLLASDQENCTYGWYRMNRFTDEDMGLWESIEAGHSPEVRVQINRISFEDGTGIGKAES